MCRWEDSRPTAFSIWRTARSQTWGLESRLLSYHSNLMSGFRIIYHTHGENNLGYCNLFRTSIPLFSLCECVHATENMRASEDSFWGSLLPPHRMGSRDGPGSSTLAAGCLSLLNHFTGSRCQILKAKKRRCSNSSLNEVHKHQLLIPEATCQSQREGLCPPCLRRRGN